MKIVTLTDDEWMHYKKIMRISDDWVCHFDYGIGDTVKIKLGKRKIIIGHAYIKDRGAMYYVKSVDSPTESIIPAWQVEGVEKER